MCGRIIQSSGPLRNAIVDGPNVRDSRVHNYPPRRNAAPSQELLVIRRNHQTGQASFDPLRWGLIPYWCQDPKSGRKPINAKCKTVRTLRRRCIVPVDGFFEWKAIKGQRAKQPYPSVEFQYLPPRRSLIHCSRRSTLIRCTTRCRVTACVFGPSP